MREGRGVDEEDDAEDQNQTLPLGTLYPNDGIVESRIYQDTSDDLIRPFDDDVGAEESLPAVRFARPLADFVEAALSNEEWHDLLHDSAEN